MTSSSRQRGKVVTSFARRGDIYWVDFEPAVGFETKKRRPALVVSNDIGNEHSGVIIVAPITSKVTRVISVEVPVIVAGRASKIMLQQVRAVDKSRLGDRIGCVDRSLMAHVEYALRIVFNLI